MGSYVEFKNVKKVYRMGEVLIEALHDATFEIEKGEVCVIVGASGAGKTTLLNILGGMDTLSDGQVLLDGKDISRYSRRELTDYRRYEIGFVFQFYNLIPNLTALENVSLATQICRDPLDAEETLTKVGLKDRLGNFPAQLSGGEQQRVAIARALTTGARIILADEPTGNLDVENSEHIIRILHTLAREQNYCVVVVTHDLGIAEAADQVLRLQDGRILPEL